MSSARNRRPRLGLRGRLALWTGAVLVVALATGFIWVHHGLKAVLMAKNDAFLRAMGRELVFMALNPSAGGRSEFREEIIREVEAHETAGLIVVERRAGTVDVTPATAGARAFAARLEPMALGSAPRTIGRSPGYRVMRIAVAPVGEAGSTLELALPLDDTEATVAQFDRRVATGALVFLVPAIAGGMLLFRQALRPVARSIATARRLNPADLSARLPRSGSGDELDQLAATVNDLLDRLAAYHAQMIRFTADASHELRSPLAAMRAAAEVALQQPRTSAEYRDTIAALVEQCDRLTALVNALLLLARADAGQAELRRDGVDLTALAEEVVDMFQPLAEERGVILSCAAAGPRAVRGDASRLRQLVTNLVDNAIAYTGPGGTVAVTVDGAGNHAALVVRDTGAGIAPEHLPHIFERFYRADPARSAEGAGLGLSLCRWIAEAHGGTLSATSVVGQGSTFSLTIPAAPDGAPHGNGRRPLASETA